MGMYLDDGYMKIEEMEVGRKYKGIGRNFNEGVWNGKGFEGIRQKWGSTFTDVELHYDADDHYGTFQPLEIVK